MAGKLVLIFLAGVAPSLFAQEADLLLRGATILDGTGAPARRADVAVREGRITAVGDLAQLEAGRVIDLSGLYLTPGFIDIHSHADGGLSDPHLAAALNNLTQGITTVVVGQDGRHAWPVGGRLGAQVELWRSHGVGNNVIPLAGQGSARTEVLGWSREPGTEEEARAVAEHVATLLSEGIWGISTGLGYFPGRFSSTEEVIEATRPVKKIDGFYISHLRNQGDELLASIEETIRIARETGVRVVATHMKASSRRNWGKSREAVARIAEARAEGLPVYADLYPYDTSSDGIDVSLVRPQELFSTEELRELAFPAGVGPAEGLRWLLARDPTLALRFDLDFVLAQDEEVQLDLAMSQGLDDLRAVPVFRRRLREALSDPARATALLAAVRERVERPGGPEIFVVDRHPDEALLGLTLAEISRARGASPERTAAELTLEGAAFTQLHMSEDDIITFIQQPYMAACTDGWIPSYGDGLTHPRSYGTFTRRIRRYVYDLGVIDLPFAIHTATGLPAEIVGLSDRGHIREGQWADLIAFDPRRVTDRATYRHPHRYSEGIDWVLVNGEVVVEEGAVNGRRAGRVLLKGEAAAVTNEE